MKTFRSKLDERMIRSMVNPLETYMDRVSEEVCRVREEAIKSIVESLGISVDGLSRKLETISDRGERIELLRKFLNERGYHMEIEMGAPSWHLFPEENIHVWKRIRTVQLQSTITEKVDNDFTGKSMCVEVKAYEIMREG